MYHSISRSALKFAVPAFTALAIAGLAIVLGAAGLAGPACANPIPESAYLVHVGSTFSGIDDCEDLVQYTEQEGTLNFYLLAYWPFEPGMSPDFLSAAVTWPDNWTFVNAVGHGIGTVAVEGHWALFEIFDLQPIWASDTMALFATVTLNVDGFGELLFDGWEDNRFFVQDMEYYPAHGRGQAGVECSYTFMKCDLSMTITPVPDPEVMPVQVRAGESEQYEIPVHIDGLGGYDLVASVTEPWLSVVDLVQLEYFEWLGTVEVDASALAVGSYEGWVIFDADARGCTLMELEVLDPVSAVPEDPAAEEGRPTDTWGGVKALYR